MELNEIAQIEDLAMSMNTGEVTESSSAGGVKELCYEHHLFGAFTNVCGKARNGVHTCQAISTFLQERANYELLYSKQLAKIHPSMKSDDWVKHLSSVWNAFHHTIAAIVFEYSDFSTKHISSIVAGIKACTNQQENQIQRLISEGTKLRNNLQDTTNKVLKAKERYEKKCSDAVEFIQLCRRPLSDSNDKADIFSKVWDNTTRGLGFASSERQKQKIQIYLEEILSSEELYIREVDAANTQCAVFERQAQDNLKAFEVTEEQRLEYIKDLLVRSEKARSSMLLKVESLISALKDSLRSIDSLDNVEDEFTKYIGVKTNESDNTPALSSIDVSADKIPEIVEKVQQMSDQGVIFTHSMLNTLVEYISAEESFVGSLDKSLKSYSASLSTDTSSGLFSANWPVVLDEGSSLKRGWDSVLTQLQRVSYLHKEFGSLLAEPVSLSLDTMKTEYNETKMGLDKDLQRSVNSVISMSTSHLKLEQKLDLKRKELESRLGLFSANSPEREKEVTLQRFMEIPMERGRKLDSKVDQLREETNELTCEVDRSLSSLKEKQEAYREEIQRVISLYMKNEKYRMDVTKSSMKSLVRAHEHLVNGLLSATKVSLLELEQISSSGDIKEFIQQNETPWLQQIMFKVNLHGNPILTEEFKTFERRPIKLARMSSSFSRFVEEVEDNSDRDKPPTSDGSQREETLGSSDLQRIFNLPSTEQLVNSFSCAIYINNFPHHGRLYLSQAYLCFTGWRDSYVVLPLIEINHIDKKNTAIVVPNAIELTTEKQGKLFFASFIYRDECVQAIMQLIQIKKQTEEILSPAPSSINMKDTIADEVMPNSSESPTISPILSLDDNLSILAQDFEPVLDQTLPFSLEFAFQRLWKHDEFFTKLLVDSGETNLRVDPWNVSENNYSAFERLENFHGMRRVSYTHNKKYMVGPSSIPTVLVQRYAYSQTEYFVLNATSTISDAPYHDYFRVESRWLFIASKQPNECHVKTGIRLNWSKSTWLKKQIEGATISESKETMKHWVTKAIEEAEQNQSISTSTAKSLDDHTVKAEPKVQIPLNRAVPPIASSVPSIPNTTPTAFQTVCLICLFILIYTVYQNSMLLRQVISTQKEQQRLLQQVLEKLSELDRV
ncbi:unnamed protein product [Aphanomyces euteiches]